MHLAPNKISILFCNASEEGEDRVRQMIEGERAGEGEGEANLPRAAFQFMLIRWPVQYASYMQMSRLHVPPIFRL